MTRIAGMALSAAFGAALLLVLAAPFAAAQTGFDRPGSDYASFAVRGGDPAVCSDRCDRESRCRAWSFAYPTTRGSRAMCWLKADVPARVESACCVSGVRGAGVIEPRAGAVEFGIDRVGGDYRSVDVANDPNGDACGKACQGDPRCRAWTFVRAGYVGASARCFLKSRVTAPRRKPCCVSGVVR